MYGTGGSPMGRIDRGVLWTLAGLAVVAFLLGACAPALEKGASHGRLQQEVHQIPLYTELRGRIGVGEVRSDYYGVRYYAGWRLGLEGGSTVEIDVQGQGTDPVLLVYEVDLQTGEASFVGLSDDVGASLDPALVLAADTPAELLLVVAEYWGRAGSYRIEVRCLEGACRDAEGLACGAARACPEGYWCRDGRCSELGRCDVAEACATQPLVHPMCVGSWSCEEAQCVWHCSADPVSPPPGQGEPCAAGDLCAPGLSCVHYYGIAGPSGPEFTSCEIPCSDDDVCPEGQRCRLVADGPGQVCRP